MLRCTLNVQDVFRAACGMHMLRVHIRPRQESRWSGILHKAVRISVRYTSMLNTVAEEQKAPNVPKAFVNENGPSRRLNKYNKFNMELVQQVIFQHLPFKVLQIRNT